MTTVERIDWTDAPEAAKALAGDWRSFPSFAWHRQYDLEDADAWAIIYTSNRDSRLLDQSNEKAIHQRLNKFTEGDDPDLVFERHSHWAVGYVDGYAVRVYDAEGSITEAFREVCRIQAALDDYPLLDEEDYGERELNATLENYANEIGSLRSKLPEGWEIEVYRHFDATGKHRYTENRDDQGGWASRDTLIEALNELGLLRPDEE